MSYVYICIYCDLFLDNDECTESLGSCDSTKGQRCVNLIGDFKCECDRKLGIFKINGSCQGISNK